MISECVAIVVQGLFEKSDSIGYDAVFQYRAFQAVLPKGNVRLFAERYDSTIYDGVDIEPISKLYTYVAEGSVQIIYHYCDGWEEFDSFLLKYDGPCAIRWHNNTPPWFYMTGNLRAGKRSLSGFENLLRFLPRQNVWFWANSEFTASQLKVLGGPIDRCSVVYPASRYLDGSIAPLASSRNRLSPESGLTILFVGRLVAHKGHKHVIACAAVLQRLFRGAVTVDFPGRADSSAVEFNKSLEQIADVSGVTVNFHGEVSEETLRGLYGRADVFMCLSEHEGFGLPVFEAMRCGIPVVAWGSSALNELLRDHPLAIEDFDIPAFASAVSSLRNPAAWKAVLSAQEQILNLYTKDAVLKQLLAAASRNAPPVMGKRRGEHAAKSVRALAAANTSKCRDIFVTEVHGLLRSQPHDFSSNYVSQHDLVALRELLSRLNQARFRLLDDPEKLRGFSETSASEKPINSIRIKHTEFTFKGGRSGPAGIVFRLPNGIASHMVFGPYAPLPVGRFEATFTVQLAVEGDAAGHIEIDVNAAGGGILASRTLTVRSGALNVPFTIEWDNKKARDPIEFRLAAFDSFPGELVFQGVELRRVHRISTVADPVSVEVVYIPKSDGTDGAQAKTSGLLRNVASLVGSSGGKARPMSEKKLAAAREHFAKGDSARDEKKWELAAREYKLGLERDPQAFAYLIQLGNVLKEAGDPQASEEAYNLAFAMRPTDPDLNLQMGHLYKKTERLAAAEQKYLQSLIGQESVLNAYQELRSLGMTHDGVMSLLSKR